ncbi:hypothetical protein A9Q84_07090 [Halobacteriovorax marinus]|uniref:Response regulatory domain-containing protein n=1 Tax=Halobacteriovorax marinus TaxID=97084 RepID=A0A1Y5F9E2_9BACT|nr:hypothetical protein A9Q84_07090 [Halobacteriovorax marinus]
MIDDSMKEDFYIEALEMFEMAEVGLLNIDRGEGFEENFNLIFRSFHNLKGAAGMFDLQALQAHMHKLETLFEETKSECRLSKVQIDFFLDGVDCAKLLLEGKESSFSFVDHMTDLNDVKLNAKVHEEKVEKAHKEIDLFEDRKNQSLIFVVDDEPVIVEILTDALQNADCKIVGFNSGKELLENLDQNPDLILSDIKMPELDGLNLLKRLSEIRMDLPLIFISGYITKDAMVEALSLGAQGFVEKPIDIDYVKKITSLVIRRYKAHKLLNKSIDYMLYQFSDLDSYLEESGKENIRKSLKNDLESILEQRKILKAVS